MGTAYNQDVTAWASEQAALLRAGRLSELDVEHIAEEIEEMGKGEMKSLRSAIREALEHLLKLRYSPSFETRADWKESVAKQRVAIADSLEDSPGLKSKLPDLFDQAWKHARRFAIMGMEKYGESPAVPEENPFMLEQVLDEDFFPESVNANQRYRP